MNRRTTMKERQNDYKPCLDNLYLLQSLEDVVKSITGDEHNSRLYLDDKVKDIIEDLNVNIALIRQIRDERLREKEGG